MTVSVAFNGTVISNADTVTGWSLIKITSGGGTPSISLADAAYEGSNNLTTRSDNKKIAVYYDIGSGNELDFTGGGNADGDMFGIWVNFLPSPLLALQSVGGLGIMMHSSAPTSSNYALWYFEGRDTYTGGWIRLVIDPTKTPSESVGTAFDPTSVRYFGAFAYNNQGTAKYDNFVWDMCSHGKGLIVTGSTTTGLTDELLTNETANRHGVVTALNQTGTAAEIKGGIILGDNVGTAATDITDENSKLFVAQPQYYQGGGLQPALPLGFMGLNIVGNGTGATDVSLGQPVGTTQGRNGIALVGNSVYDFGFDRDDGAVESADLYGCSFENLTGTLNLDGNHDFNGDTMSGCGGVSVANGATVKSLTQVASGQINLNSTGILQGCVIINNTATAAVLTTDITDISDCSFTSDGTGYAVELTSVAASPMTWANNDSGYAATDGSTGNETIFVNVGSGSLTINVTAGYTTPTIRTAGATVTVVAGAVTVQAKAALKDGTPVENARVFLKASDNTGPFPFEDAITSITRSTTTATVTTAAPHGMLTNDKVFIEGITDKTEDNYTVKTITVTGASTFTYTTTDSGSTAYTGTKTVTFVALNGLTNASGILSTSRVYSTNQPVTGWTRKSSAEPFLQEGILVGEVNSSTGFDGTAVMLGD